MDNWLTECRDQFQADIFDFLWRQWNILGIASVTASSDERIIDPETLLLFSLSVCRHEPRLFDEIVDWLFQNGHFINVQRLRQVQRKYNFACGPQLSAVAMLLAKNAKYKLKWSGLAGKHIADPVELLFFDREGKPLPTPPDQDACPEFTAHGLKRGRIHRRGYSQPFDPQSPACLLLRLRALIGMHARAEILCLLASTKEIHAAEAARQTSYYQKTVQTALLEMAQSGAVLVRTTKKTKHYRLKPNLLDTLLRPNGAPSQWLHWPSVLRTTERIWRRLDALSGMHLEPLLLASELRKLLVAVDEDGLDSGTHDIDLRQQVSAKSYPQYFRGQLERLGSILNPKRA